MTDTVHTTKCALIVPYFNESHRLDAQKLAFFFSSLGMDTIFVDDGSTDNSRDEIDLIIGVIHQSQGKYQAKNLHLKQNNGKTNAIRSGILHAHELGYSHVAITDIDLPINHKDIQLAVSIAYQEDAAIVSGARIRLSGSDVKRSALRHWIGRIIATGIWKFFHVDSYDIQSPCKVYRLNLIIDELQLPFKTKWFGDVELILRLKGKSQKVLEVHEFPLSYWRDVPEGNLGLKSALKVFLDLLKLEIIYLRT
jgi:dolichyl-phosphate beta-glucosyltransferase